MSTPNPQPPGHPQAGAVEHASADHQQLQQQLQQLQRRLIQSQRLVSLGELVGTVAHEFNNVLTTIINYAKLGLRHGDEATREKAFRKILDAGLRASRITQGVLGLARQAAERREAVSLENLVEDTLFLLERELNKHRVAVERYYRPAPQVWINPQQIQQVLVNLLVNARQAMPQGGRVILKIEADSRDGFVNLTVRDTGTGIPPERLPHIFEPFYTTKQGPDATGKGGTGLGLAMCREIIQKHNGRIRVESTPGKGTAFTLRLPVAVENEQKKAG